MAESEKLTTEDTEESEESESNYPDRPSDNPSVGRCIRAWNRAYHKKLDELDEDENDYEAEKAGKRYYLRAMPPVAGFENIRDFIACVTYASTIEIITRPEAVHFFAAAKVALDALRREIKPARGPGRPRKTTSAEENK
jgi:hypothetical protein